MRVFLGSGAPSTEEKKAAFLEAYDEAALWASEEVIAEIGKFLDMQSEHAAGRSDGQPAMRAAFVLCITVMRRDCGFPSSQYRHRVVSF
jgi:hypothetical protein